MSDEQFELSSICLITRDFLEDLPDPICIGKALYSLASFLEAWEKNGKDPHTGLAVKLSDIRAVQKPPLTVKNRLENWVLAAPTTAEDQVRREASKRIQENAQARIEEDGYLVLNGDLDLSGCTDLSALPNRLRVNGKLNLADCTGLTALPDNLKVGQNLDLQGCTGLMVLPNNLKVGESLFLRDCTSLSALPDNLTVGGSLSLTDCTRLKALPENLRVGTDLDLTDCTDLSVLPDRLSVGGSLNLQGCARLGALPDHLRVGGDLNLQGCKGLSTLPNWFATLGRRDDGEIRQVNLTDTNWTATLRRLYDGSIRQINLTGPGLSAPVLKRLKDLDNPDVQFNFGQMKEQNRVAPATWAVNKTPGGLGDIINIIVNR
ncbi:MAG: hypothetical protein P8176_03160 [Gammaproteobacteria bacterium]